MADRRCLYVNIGLFLCCFMILSDLNENINPNDTFWKVKVYFISQLESAVKIQLFHPSAECYRRKESTQVGNSQ